MGEIEEQETIKGLVWRVEMAVKKIKAEKRVFKQEAEGQVSEKGSRVKSGPNDGNFSSSLVQIRMFVQDQRRMPIRLQNGDDDSCSNVKCDDHEEKDRFAEFNEDGEIKPRNCNRTTK